MKSRALLLLLFALFFAPVVAAIFMNSSWWDGRIEATKNRGILVQPVVSLSALSFTASDASPWTFAQSDGRWVLFIIENDSGCDDACNQGLDKAQQMHRALGDHRENLQRVRFTFGAETVNSDDWLSIVDDSNALQVMISNPLIGELYLVDPLGNLMMRYPANKTARDILKDLERLLKYSKFRKADS